VEEGRAGTLRRKGGTATAIPTLLPCKPPGGTQNTNPVVGMPAAKAPCGWQAVNAPLTGGQLTTTAAMGELVNQLTSVLTN
jgi:hypothetical protein